MIILFSFVIAFFISWRIISNIRPVEGDTCVNLFTSIITGSVMLVWIGFLLRFVTTSLREISNVLFIFLLMSLILVNRLFPVIAKEKILFSTSWTLASCVLLILLILPLFFFGIRYDTVGNLIFTGNFIDFSYHLSISNAFIEQDKFIPFHPQSAGNTIFYHFLANYLGSLIISGGLDPITSLKLIQNISSITLVILLIQLFQLLNINRFGLIFSSLFFLFAHIGIFSLLFSLFGIASIESFSWTSLDKLINEMLFPYFNFLIPLHNCFSPQIPFLYGFTVVLIILCSLLNYAKYNNKETYDNSTLFTDEQNHKFDRNDDKLIFASILTSALPLIHIHSFLVLVPLVLVSWSYYKHTTSSKIIGVLLLCFSSIQLIFLFGAKYDLGYSGWDVYKTLSHTYEHKNFNPLLARIIFWLRVSGPTIIVGIISAIYFYKTKFFRNYNLSIKISLSVFVATQIILFLIINFFRPTPSWGDVNKFFLFMHLIASFLFGVMIENYKNKWNINILKLIILVAFIFPLFFDIYRKFSNKLQGTLFTACEIEYSKVLKSWSNSWDVFLTSDDLVHFIPALSGRQVYDGAYTINTGYSSPAKKAIVKDYYEGKRILEYSSGINYIFISNKERNKYKINKDFFSQNYKLIDNFNCKNEFFEVYALPTVLKN